MLQRRRNHQAFQLHRVDADRHPELVARFKIDAIPTLVVVEDRRVRARVATPRGCAQIRETLAPWLS